jgi:PIN domain nuclease of toxin-antitoxin system
MALLLDTCAAVWFFEGMPIAAPAIVELKRAADAGEPLYISPVTAWELGMLVSRGRMTLRSNPQSWFDRLSQEPGLQLVKISPAVLIASSFLPGKPPKDPADRIFAATVRANGWRLVTRDRMLLDYARDGHIEALAC